MARIYFLAIFSLVSAQEEAVFPEFEEFHRVAYLVQGNLYFKAKTKKDYGNYDLKNKNSWRPRIGIDYVIHPERELSFRTGFYIDYIPLFNIDLEFLPQDIPEEYRKGNNKEHIFSEFYKKNVFTVPLLLDLKKQLGEKLFFNTAFGFEINYLNSMYVDGTYAYTDNTTHDIYEMFGFYAENANDFNLYAGIRISPGFYYFTKKVLYHLELTYTYKLTNLLKGEYQFGNLFESDPTRGPYTFRGSYLGLGLSVSFKKKSRK